MNVGLIKHPTEEREPDQNSPDIRCERAVTAMMIDIDECVRLFNQYPDLIRREAFDIALSLERMKWLVSAVKAGQKEYDHAS